MNEKKITKRFGQISKEALNKTPSPQVNNFFTDWRNKQEKNSFVKIPDSQTTRTIEEEDPTMSSAILRILTSVVGKKAVRKTQDLRDKKLEEGKKRWKKKE